MLYMRSENQSSHTNLMISENLRPSIESLVPIKQRVRKRCYLVHGMTVVVGSILNIPPGHHTVGFSSEEDPQRE